MSEAKAPARPKRKSTDVMPARRLFTADEYHRMGETGILLEDERTELLNGEILLMAPIGSRHFGCVNTLTAWLVPALVGRAIVSVQNPVRLSLRSEPQPDLALLRPRRDRYYSGLPAPEDVFLVIEVSDTTLRYDRDTKLPLYAEAGIPEAWIVNLVAGSVLIGREPAPTGYQHVETVTRAGRLSPAAFPDVSIAVEDLLG